MASTLLCSLLYVGVVHFDKARQETFFLVFGHHRGVSFMPCRIRCYMCNLYSLFSLTEPFMG